jgi:hypothetical protein
MYEDSYEKKVAIRDDWFDNNPRGIYWIESFQAGGNSHNKGQFHPRAVVFNRASGGGNYAEVECILHSENETDWTIYRLEVGRIHKLSIRAIRAQHTNAREIRILA